MDTIQSPVSCVGQGHLLRIERTHFFSLQQYEVYSACAEDGKTMYEYKVPGWNNNTIDAGVIIALVVGCVALWALTKKK